MVIGMCVGVLDEKIGPTSVYNLNLTKSLSKKLAMKVMVGVMSFSSETNEDNLRGESIIPFLKEKLITFSYFFPVNDPKARGGKRQSSLILAFSLDNRRIVYENATTLARLLKSASEIIEQKHIQELNFPSSLSERYEAIRSMILSKSTAKVIKDDSQIDITCPQCSNKKKIDIPSVVKGIKFIEHQIFENEICEHTFIVYLDTKFNVLGYKDPEIEMTDMKDMLGKLKSPYD